MIIRENLLFFFLLTVLNEMGSSQDLRFLRQNIVPLVEVTSDAPANCTEPVWSSWTENLPCNDDCGACGRRTEKRECTTPGCPCSGPSRKESPCNIQACDYPRPACCPPFKLMMVKEQFTCGPQDDDVEMTFVKSINPRKTEENGTLTDRNS